MVKKYGIWKEVLNLDYVSEDLSKLFLRVLKTQLVTLYQNVNSWSEFEKELAKIKNKFYIETDKYFEKKLWGELKSKIDKVVKSTIEILTTKDLDFQKKIKNLDNTSDSIDMLQELKNRSAEISDILISNIKLPDVLKYLKYIRNRTPKLSEAQRKIFDKNMKKIRDNYKEHKNELLMMIKKSKVLEYVFWIKDI